MQLLPKSKAPKFFGTFAFVQQLQELQAKKRCLPAAGRREHFFSATACTVRHAKQQTRKK